MGDCLFVTSPISYGCLGSSNSQFGGIFLKYFVSVLCGWHFQQIFQGDDKVTSLNVWSKNPLFLTSTSLDSKTLLALDTTELCCSGFEPSISLSMIAFWLNDISEKSQSLSRTLYQVTLYRYREWSFCVWKSYFCGVEMPGTLLQVAFPPYRYLVWTCCLLVTYGHLDSKCMQPTSR